MTNSRERLSGDEAPKATELWGFPVYESWVRLGVAGLLPDVKFPVRFFWGSQLPPQSPDSTLTEAMWQETILKLTEELNEQGISGAIYQQDVLLRYIKRYVEVSTLPITVISGEGTLGKPRKRRATWYIRPNSARRGGFLGGAFADLRHTIEVWSYGRKINSLQDTEPLALILAATRNPLGELQPGNSTVFYLVEESHHGYSTVGLRWSSPLDENHHAIVENFIL